MSAWAKSLGSSSRFAAKTKNVILLGLDRSTNLECQAMAMQVVPRAPRRACHIHGWKWRWASKIKP